VEKLCHLKQLPLWGASGPGKTSLFNAISGRTGNHNNNTGPLVLDEGDIRFGDHSLKILPLEKSFKIILHALHSLIRFMKH
jgi:ABC-type transport system involved in cytochrome bd biosynthesis fused ATPase/permease subunit